MPAKPKKPTTVVPVDAATGEDLTPQLQSLAADLNVMLSGSVAERMALVATSVNQAAVHIVAAGLLLISVKSECQHGEFSAHLEAIGITRQRSAELMSYATFAAELPPKDRAKVLELPKRKVLNLAAADPTVVSDALADDDMFDDLTNLNWRDMRDRLRRMEGKVTDLQIEAETKNSQIKELRRQANRSLEGGIYPAFVMLTREEANAQAEKAMLACDDLTQLFNELLAHLDIDPGNQSIAATTLYTHVNAVLARYQQLAQRMADELGKQLTAVDAKHFLTGPEIDRALADRALLVQDHEQEKRKREAARELAKPKGRGRPKKQ